MRIRNVVTDFQVYLSNFNNNEISHQIKLGLSVFFYTESPNTLPRYNEPEQQHS